MSVALEKVATKKTTGIVLGLLAAFGGLIAVGLPGLLHLHPDFSGQRYLLHDRIQRLNAPAHRRRSPHTAFLLYALRRSPFVVR